MAIQALASIVLIMLSTSTTTRLSRAATPFNPTLEWTCDPSSISVAIRTALPFGGIAHPKGQSLNCTVIGNGTNVTRMNIPLTAAESRKCGVKFNKETGLYWLEIEVHEHKLLILEQDRIFNVTCEKNATLIKVGDNDGDHLIQNDDNDFNATDVVSPSGTTSISFSLDRPIEFNLELLPNPENDESMLSLESLSNHDVGYGQSYNMKISFKSENDKTQYGDRFRPTHCVAQADDIAVELINSHGCSINRKLVTDFVYKNGSATAKIPSMFRFPNSKTMKLECKLSICQDFQVCRPSCDRKMDDPIAEVEDAEMIAHLLGMDDDSIQTAVTGPMQSAETETTKSTSTIVHVLDRREIPLKNDVSPSTATSAPYPIRECVLSHDVIILYRIIIGLIFTLLIGLLLNCCCCMCYRRRVKNTTIPLKCRGPGLVKNEYWISGNSSPSLKKEYQQDETGFSPYGEVSFRKSSVGSYASVKHRISSRLPQEPYQMQDKPQSFRPITQAPSPPSFRRITIEDPLQRHSQHSTFKNSISPESTSGASTWHESPGRNSNQIDTNRESYSIL